MPPVPPAPRRPRPQPQETNDGDTTVLPKGMSRHTTTAAAIRRGFPWFHAVFPCTLDQQLMTPAMDAAVRRFDSLLRQRLAGRCPLVPPLMLQGPSGCGKTTAMHLLQERMPDCRVHWINPCIDRIELFAMDAHHVDSIDKSNAQRRVDHHRRQAAKLRARLQQVLRRVLVPESKPPYRHVYVLDAADVFATQDDSTWHLLIKLLRHQACADNANTRTRAKPRRPKRAPAWGKTLPPHGPIVLTCTTPVPRVLEDMCGYARADSSTVVEMPAPSLELAMTLLYERIAPVLHAQRGKATGSSLSTVRRVLCGMDLAKCRKTPEGRNVLQQPCDIRGVLFQAHQAWLAHQVPTHHRRTPQHEQEAEAEAEAEQAQVLDTTIDATVAPVEACKALFWPPTRAQQSLAARRKATAAQGHLLLPLTHTNYLANHRGSGAALDAAVDMAGLLSDLDGMAWKTSMGQDLLAECVALAVPRVAHRMPRATFPYKLLKLARGIPLGTERLLQEQTLAIERLAFALTELKTGVKSHVAIDAAFQRSMARRGKIPDSKRTKAFLCMLESLRALVWGDRAKGGMWCVRLPRVKPEAQGMVHTWFQQVLDRHGNNGRAWVLSKYYIM